MANMVLLNCYVSINGVDLSTHCRSASLKYEAEMVDDTMFGGDGTRSNIAGLKNWSLDCEFEQDFAAAQVDATLFNLIGAAAFTVAVRPDAGAIADTNPEFSGLAVLENYTPMGGTVGELGMTSCTFRCAGALGRDVTP